MEKLCIKTNTRSDEFVHGLSSAQNIARVDNSNTSMRQLMTTCNSLLAKHI